MIELKVSNTTTVLVDPAHIEAIAHFDRTEGVSTVVVHMATGKTHEATDRNGELLKKLKEAKGHK